MCDACLRRGENLAKYSDNHLCDGCAALFWAAQVLFLNEITDETKIIPTLVVAQS
jgi:hypothetical protein